MFQEQAHDEYYMKILVAFHMGKPNNQNKLILKKGKGLNLPIECISRRS